MWPQTDRGKWQMARVTTAAGKLHHFRLGTWRIVDSLHSRECTKHSRWLPDTPVQIKDTSNSNIAKTGNPEVTVIVFSHSRYIMEQHVKFHHNHFLSHPVQLSVNSKYVGEATQNGLLTLSVTTHIGLMACNTHHWLWWPYARATNIQSTQMLVNLGVEGVQQA